MFDTIFSSILTNGTFTGSELAISTLASLVCGLIIAGAYMIKNRCSRSFLITLILLPSIVELVIILVNGNIGAGVAVAGAFSLVRFRSAPGRGQEITGIFLAMAAGLATGMGYVGVAILFSLLISGINLLLNLTDLNSDAKGMKTLKITVPENLDYEGKFDDIFKRYLKSYTYEEVRTTNMGSLYRITLSVLLKDNVSTKDFIDDLRTGNGNLDISLGRMIDSMDSL
ncbi:MAG: DUF4956 domain-containing protein [Lachnospiraceae bacterium]|nr:DUF4956 domain-containing protein [Lachnospiraceae bacterium]MCR5406936.1 DUF4956 domain-containing protein [Lachnospiraceae bacterium]